MRISFGFLAVAASLLAISSASAGTLTTNVAFSGNGGVGYGGGTPANLNDQNSSTQNDTSGGYDAVVFSSIQTVNQLFFQQVPGNVQNGFNLQVANVANPNPAIGGDWSTVQSYSGVASNGQSWYPVSGSFTTQGIRLETTNNSNVDGLTRPVELWAFKNYNNLATSATVSTTGPWSSPPGSILNNDQIGTAQIYTGVTNGTASVQLNWGTAQRVGEVAINGGGGVGDTSHLVDYDINYWNGSSWALALAVRGNVNKFEESDLGTITTTGLQVVIQSGDSTGDGNARLSQIMVFAAPVPEPGSATLAVFGVVGVWLLRRHHRLSVKQ